MPAAGSNGWSTARWPIPSGNIAPGPATLVVPTALQFELYKWVKRERDESRALEVIALTEEARVMPLSTGIALSAGDLALAHRLSFADALIYATARRAGASLVTCDDHFDGLEDVIYHRKP
ncbi:MAG: type II toxin-antitoxin system VapC family toxin [Halofilum sp. (in: g-proteobacteria)]|nr:type II toxin-antitoxin system VapC family toxin [Halofilum sp. (in: g-proteobacteria)]